MSLYATARPTNPPRRPTHKPPNTMNISTSSPALQSRHFESYAPSTPTASQPPLPHSTSSPSISASSSLPRLASPNTSKSKNYHPYLIQSTASSLLSRSNSSPSQPHYGLSKHRPSRSMSSLAGNTSGSEVDSPANGDAGSANSGDRRKSLESPLARRPMVRSSKSGTLPRFLEEKETESPRKHVQLPVGYDRTCRTRLMTGQSQVLDT